MGTDLFDRPVDYRHIKAVAAIYELQDYAANRIALAVHDGFMEPDP